MYLKAHALLERLYDQLPFTPKYWDDYTMDWVSRNGDEIQIVANDDPEETFELWVNDDLLYKHITLSDVVSLFPDDSMNLSEL